MTEIEEQHAELLEQYRTEETVSKQLLILRAIRQNRMKKFVEENRVKI